VSEENSRGRRKRPKHLPVKVLLGLSVEMHERLRREAAFLQSNVNTVVRARLARSIAQDDVRAS
jgi:hypothetical protein